jgi:chlorobactene glucosyltransferase
MTVAIGVFISAALIVLGMTAALNALLFLRLRPVCESSRSQKSELISLLIPARNEASVIGATVQRLLNQDYPNIEVIVLDDNSTDKTAEIALSAGQGDTRLHVIPGKPLPPGWLGKNWACQQLAEAAQGDLLIFTDADVIWSPGALSALVAQLEHTQADLLTVWPTQHTHSWPERLIVPLMALAIIAYLPILPVHHSPWAAFAAANGQCMSFRRRAYEQVGGHASVRDRIVEDVELARAIKRAGQLLRMFDGNGLIACRMYRDWDSVRDGFAKNILAGHGDSPVLLVISAIFHNLVFVLPWLWLLLDTEYPVWPLALIAAGLTIRALTAVVTRQRVLDALLLPVSVLLMNVIAVRSLWWHWRYGGPRWKGRSIAQPRSVTYG